MGNVNAPGKKKGKSKGSKSQPVEQDVQDIDWELLAQRREAVVAQITAALPTGPSSSSSSSASAPSGGVQVEQIVADNLDLALVFLQVADDLSAADDGTSIFKVRSLPRLQRLANDNYRAWIELLETGVRAAVLEFVYLAARLPGESPANVVVQIKDVLARREPSGPAEKLRLDFLKDQVDAVKKAEILPIQSFVPAALQRGCRRFMTGHVLKLIIGKKQLPDLNEALFDFLDELSLLLAAIRPVELGHGEHRTRVDAADIKEIVEQIMLAQVAMFNFHGHDANAELRMARSELDTIRQRLDASKARLPDVMEIVSEFFVDCYAELLTAVLADSGVTAEQKRKAAELEFSPKNVFFVLMSELIQHLLLNLPARVANAMQQRHKNVLFDYEGSTMLEVASKLLEAEDYFQCGQLRVNYERLATPATPLPSKMDLLFSVAAAQFWRVVKTDSVAVVWQLGMAALQDPAEPSDLTRHLKCLLAAHRILQALDRSAIPPPPSKPPPLPPTQSSDQSSSSQSSSQPSSSQSSQSSSQTNDASKNIIDIEQAIFSLLARVRPSDISAADLPNFRVLVQSFIRFVDVNRIVTADRWPDSWQPVFSTLEQTAFFQPAPTPAPATAQVDDGALSSPALRRAIDSSDLSVICSLLRDGGFAEGSPELDFSRSVRLWLLDFMHVYRQRFDYICPFGFGVESFRLDDDNATPLPATNPVRAYRLSTGTLISEFGRRGLGFAKQEEYDQHQVGTYAPRDPTNRQKIVAYWRDRDAERNIIGVFASLQRLQDQLATLPTDGLHGEIVAIMRRHIDRFDSAFLESTILGNEAS